MARNDRALVKQQHHARSIAGAVLTGVVISPALTFEDTLAAFLRDLLGKNRCGGTIRAYKTDVQQLVDWFRETNPLLTSPAEVLSSDLSEYLAHLADRQLSGVSRARKLAAIREYFRFLEQHGALAKSPASCIDTPRREQKTKTAFRPDEYSKILSAAGASPRDYAMFQVFLQAGVRVSELCGLALTDVDLKGAMLHVRKGKGQKERDIALPKKAVQALKSYLAVRPETGSDALFLNRYGEPLGDRGVRKLVLKYLKETGISKHASPHTFRHTFGTIKTEKGMSVFDLMELMGHSNIRTTQQYVHLSRVNRHKLQEATSL